MVGNQGRRDTNALDQLALGSLSKHAHIGAKHAHIREKHTHIGSQASMLAIKKLAHDGIKWQ